MKIPKINIKIPKIEIPKMSMPNLETSKVNPTINPELLEQLTTTSEVLDFLKQHQAANEKFQSNQVTTNKRFHKQRVGLSIVAALIALFSAFLGFQNMQQGSKLAQFSDKIAVLESAQDNANQKILQLQISKQKQQTKIDSLQFVLHSLNQILLLEESNAKIKAFLKENSGLRKQIKQQQAKIKTLEAKKE